MNLRTYGFSNPVVTYLCEITKLDKVCLLVYFMYIWYPGVDWYEVSSMY